VQAAGAVEEVTVPSTPCGWRPAGERLSAVKSIRRCTMLAVRLRFPLATLAVEWVHREVPGSTVNHLNLRASRLPGRKVMDVGGILGRDDHAAASTPTGECESNGWDLRAPRSEDEDDDLDEDWLIASHEGDDSDED